MANKINTTNAAGETQIRDLFHLILGRAAKITNVKMIESDDNVGIATNPSFLIELINEAEKHFFQLCEKCT